MNDHGYYGPGSMAWKIGSEAVLSLGSARAVLMQLAHPLVATGVSEHSSYLTDPIGRTERTFMLSQMLTFGTLADARKAAQTINRLHLHVHGTLPADAGAYAEGTPYSARNQELLLWVFATLIDTVLLVHPLLIAPLSPAEEEQYYEDSKTIAHLLGLLPDTMPRTVEDLRQYVNEMVQSNCLAATPQARQLARVVLFPPLPSIFRPFLHLHFQITCALLPQPIREIYGLEWSKLQQRAFDLSMLGMRTIIPRLPMSLRVLPITRRMMQQTAGQPA